MGHGLAQKVAWLRPQAPFCYGSVSLSSSELQPVTYRSLVISKPLERAPGRRLGMSPGFCFDQFRETLPENERELVGSGRLANCLKMFEDV